MTPESRHEWVLGDFDSCAYCAEQTTGFCETCHLYVCQKPGCREKHEREKSTTSAVPRPRATRPKDVDLDRRRPERRQVEGIRVEYPDTQPRIRDISVYGAYIEDLHPAAVNSSLRIRLWLSESMPISARAIVRRADETGMAVEFTEISSSDRARLEDFIRGHGEV